MTDHTHLELLTDVGDVSVIVHHLNKGKVVSLPALVVVVVVGGGDLDSPRTKRHLNHLIGNYGELTVTEWVETFLPNQVLGGGERAGGRETGRVTRREREADRHTERREEGRKRESY